MPVALKDFFETVGGKMRDAYFCPPEKWDAIIWLTVSGFHFKIIGIKNIPP